MKLIIHIKNCIARERALQIQDAVDKNTAQKFQEVKRIEVKP